ncbi:MAG: glycosyltransferase [bacterium]|nr:glycosyltransferase [bacterium]
MINQPLVSFLISAYNEEKYIVECVDSCLNQTYSNIEVCVTDDGSNDGTWHILTEKYKDNKYVKLFKFAENKGKVLGFNKSYEMATGEYFALIGGDDVNVEDRILNSYNYLTKNNCEFLFSIFTVCNEKLEEISLIFDVKHHDFSVEKILIDNFMPGGTMFFNKSIANKIFPIPSNLKLEDWWIAFIAASYVRIGFFNQSTIRYRYTGKNNQIFPDESIVKKYNTIAKNYTRHFDYYDALKKYILTHDIYENKKRKLKIIEIGKIHKTIVVKDQILVRVKLFPRFLKNFVFNRYFFKVFVLFLLGIRPLFVIQKYLYKLKNISFEKTRTLL